MGRWYCAVVPCGPSVPCTFKILLNVNTHISIHSMWSQWNRGDTWDGRRPRIARPCYSMLCAPTIFRLFAAVCGLFAHRIRRVGTVTRFVRRPARCARCIQRARALRCASTLRGPLSSVTRRVTRGLWKSCGLHPPRPVEILCKSQGGGLLPPPRESSLWTAYPLMRSTLLQRGTPCTETSASSSRIAVHSVG